MPHDSYWTDDYVSMDNGFYGRIVDVTGGQRSGRNGGTDVRLPQWPHVYGLRLLHPPHTTVLVRSHLAVGSPAVGPST